MKKIQRIILAFMLGIVPIQSALADSRADELVLAAVNGKLGKVKTLIEQEGVDINTKATKKMKNITALIGASLYGQLEIVKYLIDKGADINAKANDGVTALMEASTQGHLEIVQYLINKGADINAKANLEINGKNFDGFTALMLASGEGHLEVVKYLISKGANVNAVATIEDGVAYTATALDGAINNKHHKVAEVLKNAGAKSADEIKK